jgi:hypothetical protein
MPWTLRRLRRYQGLLGAAEQNILHVSSANDELELSFQSDTELVEPVLQ